MLGVIGVARVGPGLLVFIVIGPVLVLGYNLELFGGWMHTDLGFAAAWGAFPVLVAYYVQAERLDLTAALAATAALGLSLAQRFLSTPARALRRRVARVDGSVTLHDGTVHELDEPTLLKPLERALRSMSWGMLALARARRRPGPLRANPLAARAGPGTDSAGWSCRPSGRSPGGGTTIGQYRARSLRPSAFSTPRRHPSSAVEPRVRSNAIATPALDQAGRDSRGLVATLHGVPIESKARRQVLLVPLGLLSRTQDRLILIEVGAQPQAMSTDRTTGPMAIEMLTESLLRSPGALTDIDPRPSSRSPTDLIVGSGPGSAVPVRTLRSPISRGSSCETSLVSTKSE